MMRISIIKDSRRYRFITSQQYQTTMQLTIKRDNTQEGVFFMPLEDKLIEIDVTDSKGKKLPQLSDTELQEKFNITLKETTSKDKITHDEDFVRIPILLPASDSEFEVLSITFNSPIDPKKYKLTKRSPNMRMDFGFRISPSEFSINSENYDVENHPYTLDMAFETGDDYKIQNHTKISIEPAGESRVISPKKDLPNLVAFHVEQMDFESNATGMITLGISESTYNMAWAISVTAIILPMFLVFGQIVVEKLFTPTLEIIGGVIAVLIGSRIWIIQDKYIMKKWADLHHAILIINASLFVTWFIIWMSGEYTTL